MQKRELIKLNFDERKGVFALKKLICKREYDTDTAVLLKKVTSGEYGDPQGYEESLYQTPGGLYFLYVNGGEASVYAKEDIKCLSKAKAEAWLATHR